MSKQEILYVAYKDEPLDDGISYATYLANLLGEKLRVVLLSRGGISRKFNNMMAAVSFAEANEHGTAREMLAGDSDGREMAQVQTQIMDKCQGEGVDAVVHIGLEATVSVILNFLTLKKIDIVLLSPAVTGSRNILGKLVKQSPRPVITMARGASYTNS